MKKLLSAILFTSVSFTTTLAENVSRIYIVDRDGKNLTMVADDTALKDHRWLGSPSWSPDGNWVLFDITKNGRFGATHLMKVAVAGPDSGKIIDLGVGLGGIFSPSGKQIVFFLNGNNPMKAKSGLWMMNADGTDRKRIGSGFYPQWSPDGKRILAVNSHRSPRKLLLLDGEGFKRQEILTDKVVIGLPTWASDSERFAVTILDGKERAMTIFKAEKKSTSNEELFREEWHKGYEETWPDWSPNGKELIFTLYNRNENGRGMEIFIMNATAGALPKKFDVTPPNTHIRDAQFSRDGKRIAFAAMGREILANAKELKE